jgi:hypothetical protein
MKPMCAFCEQNMALLTIKTGGTQLTLGFEG